MSPTALQSIANNYAKHGLSVYPALPQSKEPAGSWKAFQRNPPTDAEREALFSINSNLNIGVICGLPSGNLAVIDCETPRAFDDSLRRVERAGYSETWTVQSNRGGHIYLRLPVAVQPLKLMDMEVRGQGQFVLAPPSQHPAGPIYKFLNDAPTIAHVESLRELDWLPLKAAPFRTQVPRSAMRLLHGDPPGRYQSRSEVEQAIITILVNASFSFDDILAVFRSAPAAGKFASLEQRDGTARAVGWLRTGFNKARVFCATESPSRVQARELLSRAIASAWPGRTGSTDKAIFCAHITLAYRSGLESYHASSRELAEIAGCERSTATAATHRLRVSGYLELVARANYTFANRYRLHPNYVRVSLNIPLTTHPCEGVAQTSSFLLPDAFRHRSLGRPAYEVVTALHGGCCTVKEIASRTGRHPQTVRNALRKMFELGFVENRGQAWRAQSLDEIAISSERGGLTGALEKQRQKHHAERLRFRVSRAVLRAHLVLVNSRG